jgi:3-dehydroquinate dehydratase type I
VSRLKKPRICISIPGYSTEYILKQYELNREQDPDLIEIRLDYKEKNINLIQIRKRIEVPLIATNRKRDQGKVRPYSEKKRISSLLEAAKLEWDYVDIDLSTSNFKNIVEKIHKNETKIIGSYHDFLNTPDPNTFNKVLGESKELGADICKIVGMAQNYNDNFFYLDFLRKHPFNVSFAMGKYGTPSRVFSALLGGAYTYASSEFSLEVAPGQINIRELNIIYDILGVSR